MNRGRCAGSRTTFAIRREIRRRRDEPSRKLALSLWLDPKTVDKWKRRETANDAPIGPKRPVSTVLSATDEALIVVFRKHTRLTLDESLARLKPLIRKLSRSALHRCLKRYGLNRIPGGGAKKLDRLEAGRPLNVMTLKVAALHRSLERYGLNRIHDSSTQVVGQARTYCDGSPLRPPYGRNSSAAPIVIVQPA